MQNLVNQTLNQRYKIVSLLGEGGMGAVLKGFDPVLERTVAIKVMHPHFARQPNMRERFLQEARTAGKLNHSSIVKVYDFGQQESLLYIVMEFIEGDNLRVMLDGLKAKKKWLTLKESLLITAQLSSALHYAHRHGVLHRDIKPANVMIVPEPTSGLSFRPVLTDLGLVKLLEGQAITQEGVSMGTPAYMSPEQAMGQKIDARSDVYSLGILLYELIVGHPPFPARSISEAIRYHTKEPPAPPRSIRTDVPVPIEEVILKAISKTPAQRYPDAEVFAQTLHSIQLSGDRAATSAAVSLMTEYQHSVMGRGASVLGAFKPLSQSGTDTLQVIDPHQNNYAYAMEKNTLTIGRGKDNDIVIDDSKLSRQHARIERSGNDFTVTDLQSTNGTFLGNTRLLPGVPEIWPADKALRLGNSWLNLKRTEGAEKEHATEAYPQGLGQQPLRTFAQSITGKRVTAMLEKDLLIVEPGELIQTDVHLLNHGQLVDHFRLHVSGISEEWVTFSHQEMQLMPGERSVQSLTIHPPRQPDARAGDHPIKIQVLSQVAAGEHTEIDAVLRIKPYYQFDFVLKPQRQRGTTEANYITVLRNLCNTPMNFFFEAEDPEARCSFRFEPQIITAQPGHETSGTLTVGLSRVLPTDASRTFRFTVTARLQESPEMTRQSFAEWEKTPLNLEVEMRPATVRSISSGRFYVHLRNQSEQDLPVQLEGMDDEDLCRFVFDPKSVVVPSGGESRVSCMVESNVSLRTAQEKVFDITVTASLVNIPGMQQKASAKWIRIQPSFEVQIRSIQDKGVDEGRYLAVVKNLSNEEILFHLNGVDQDKKCQFQFDTPTAMIPPGEERQVPFAVKSLVKIYGDAGVKHPFQLIVHPEGSPEVEKRLDAVWEQMPSTRNGSLFLCWLMILIGWGIAIGVQSVLVEGFLNGGDEFQNLIVGLIGGALSGGIGGFLTGLGIKIAQPDFRVSHILGSTIAWAALWAFYFGPLILLLN